MIKTILSLCMLIVLMPASVEKKKITTTTTTTNSFGKDFGLISFFSAAEVGSSLQAFDPNTVSMIILEELPLLVSSSPAGCLIPDRVFAEDLICKREKELR